MTWAGEAFRSDMDLMALYLSGLMRALKFGVGGSGLEESGCWMFAKFLKVSAGGDWK